jgi:serine/threonine protein kinase
MLFLPSFRLVLQQAFSELRTHPERWYLCVLQIFAVKAVKVPSRLDAAFANAIIVEVQLLRQLDHVHIVHFEDYIETPLTKNIIMEFCSKGDLHTFINSHRSQG